MYQLVSFQTKPNTISTPFHLLEPIKPLAREHYELGNSYYKQKDYEKAFYHYYTAAEREHGGAENMLGVMYLSGQFVSKDLNKAEEWLRISISHFHQDAWANLVRVCEEKTMKKVCRICFIVSSLLLAVAIVTK